MSDPGNREAPEGFKRNYSEMTNSFNSSNITNIIQVSSKYLWQTMGQGVVLKR